MPTTETTNAPVAAAVDPLTTTTSRSDVPISPAVGTRPVACQNELECKEMKERKERHERNERQARHWNATLEELRVKLDREKHEALNTQKEAMNRTFRVQLAKLIREKEELQRKLQNAVSETNVTPSNANELQKLAHENAVLRNEKKRLEDQLQMLKESEQSRFTNMRSQLDEKACQLSNWQKQSRQQITRLREETKAKDRVISQLEAELRIQTGRAQQFRDLLEQNLAAHTSSVCCNNRAGHQHEQLQREREELTNRHRKLQIQVEDLQEAMRQQQETFANEKRELLRRLSESERQQSPLRQKSKQYLTRNVQLAAKNKELEETLKKMQEESGAPISSNGNLKRSLTRPNLTRLGTPPQTNDKQRRMEYVQQVQKLRKEQRYYSMWELPPLLEVETDSAADISDSSDSGSQLSPAATSSSGVNSCSSDSWNEETRRELEVLFSQLSREHSELQRSYQVLHEKLRQLTCFSESDALNVNYATLQADYSAARARIRDLEEILQLKNNQDQVPRQQGPSLLEIQAKFVREKHSLQTQIAILNHHLQESRQKCLALQAEINEARDQNELLEFRILELEECHERISSRCSSPRDRKDVCTDTDSDDLSVGDSGITSLTSYPTTADCPPSPVSVSNVSNPDGDFLTDKIANLKAELESLSVCLHEPSQKAVVTQLQALLGVCQNRLTVPGKNCSARSPLASVDQTGWEWHLQESGIFEGIEEPSLEVSTQTEVGDQVVKTPSPPPTKSTSEAASATETFTEDKETQTGLSSSVSEDHSVQTTPHEFLQDQSVQFDPLIIVDEFPAQEAQTDSLSSSSEDHVATGVEMGVEAGIETREQGVQWSRDETSPAEVACQTEDDVISVKAFRDIEEYYVQQIEQLQKEKSDLRKHNQMERDERSQLSQQLELTSRQLQAFQEREVRFEETLQSQRQSHDLELEAARQSATDQLSNLKECLQLIWHELKDSVPGSDHNIQTSILPCKDGEPLLEFARRLIDSIQMLCAELNQLRGRVIDLADMEKAFQTTLQQADGLVSHIEQQHLQRIRELELSEHELRSQLEHHREQLKQQSASSVYPASEVNDYLEAKIKDLESENELLSMQLCKHQEMQDHCQHLRNRVEELEQLDKNFKQAVQEAERRFLSREQRYREELESLREELETSRSSEANRREQLEQKERLLVQLRVELDQEQKTVAGLENDVKQLNSKVEKDDTSFRNEVTKLRSQLNMSMVQLNELESLNCQLREQISQQQNQIAILQRSLEEETARCQDLMAENGRILHTQMDLHNRNSAKPLTLELFEAELKEPETDEATLDDFREISLPNTPTVLDGCSDVFEEHFKVLESLESYLETQHLVAPEEGSDESGVSVIATSPSAQEADRVSQLEAQITQLRLENHSLLNTYTAQSAAKDDISSIIHLLIDQLKSSAPHQSLVEMASHIRQMSSSDSPSAQTVCRLLETPASAPVTSSPAATKDSIKCIQIAPAPAAVVGTRPLESAMPSCSPCKVVPRTITVLPEQDPYLSPATDLRVTRRVGQDGLVVAWLPSPDQECAGYLICVNDQEAQRVRSAQRTKAVLCGLDLSQEMNICIYALAVNGKISAPARAFYHPENDPYPSLSTPDASLSSMSLPSNPDMEVTSEGVHLSVGEKEDPSPREVVVQTFYTNSSVTVRSSRRVTVNGSRIPLPVRSGLP